MRHGFIMVKVPGINDDFMKELFVGDLGLAPMNLVNREEPIMDDGLA